MQKIDGFWIIETYAHLNEVREALDDKYRLANNISSTGVWIFIGTEDRPFRGIFDGSNFTLSNISISGGKDYTGFFGCINNASILNLDLDIDSAAGGSYTGGLAGQSYSSTIDNCFVSVSPAEGRKVSGNKYVGGLIGFADRSTISGCSVTGTISSSDHYPGGLVGYSDRSVIKSSFSDTSVQGNRRSKTGSYYSG